MKRLLLLTVFMTFIASMSYAHDAWIAKKDGQIVIVYGHGNETESYDISNVKEVKAYGTNGGIIQVSVEKAGYPVMIHAKGEPALNSMFFDNGFWVKTPDGWKNKPKKNQPDAVESLHSVKFS